MCVTSGPAHIEGTRTYVYAPAAKEGEVQRHVCGYQNTAETRSGPNCMFLNFAGSDLRLVNGPEHTRSFMKDMTRGLPQLRYYVEMSRGGGSFGARSVAVVNYGDYTVVIAQEPANMLDALDRVPRNRRPHAAELEDMINFYMSYSPDHGFLLGCFDGNVKPKHPIVVDYIPNNPDVLTIPGLDGHDGKLPTPGAPVYRDFAIAFGMAGVQLPREMHYQDNVDPAWAPSSVTGFVDNRLDGPNGDYVMPIEAVQSGLQGRPLADQLVTSF